MPANARAYAQMAVDTAKQITCSYQSWTAFLTTAARLYKYPYLEQLMIFAQRPDATACAEYDLWTNTMGRYIRRGSKGIALTYSGFLFLDDAGLPLVAMHWEHRFNHMVARYNSIYIRANTCSLRSDQSTPF